MPELPKFDPHDFRPGQPIDSPYFPLKEGFTYQYRGKAQNDAGQLVPSPDNVSVAHLHKPVDGIQVLVVHDNVYLNGLLEETTQDYYAQDVHGNVWYMGEFETSFIRDKHGKIIKISHESSWEAGVNGAEPGFIMEARPKVGDNYFQEHAPGVALDTAKVAAVDLTLNVQGKIYHHIVLTREFSQLEPTVLDYKWYAPGVGMVLEREFDSGKLDAESRFVSITPNKSGPTVGALEHGTPRLEGVQLAGLLPWELAGHASGVLTAGEAFAHTGVPIAFPVDGHVPPLDLAGLF